VGGGVGGGGEMHTVIDDHQANSIRFLLLAFLDGRPCCVMA